MAKQKESLLIQFKKIIDENIEKGAKTSDQLRIGIPSSFIAADGREYRLSNVTRYMRTGKNPTFLDVEKNKIVTAARANALKIQTSPNVDKWDKKTDAVKGLEAHHKRGVKMYAPFYEGLNEKQAQELTQWFVDEGVPLGDAKSNLVNLPKDLHVGEEGIHTWMKENNIQVLPDETGKGNFITINKGKHKGDLFVKGSPGSAVRAVMPSVKHLTLNERLPAIATWLKYVQEPVDTKLAELQWDDYRSKNKPKASDALQIPEIQQEFAEEAKIKANGNGNGNGNGVNGKNGTNGKLNGITTGSGKARLVDSALQIGSNVATGNYAGAAIGAGTLAGSQVLQNSVVQKKVAQQITKLIAERGAKSAAKLIPGLDIALSGKESWDYLRQGKLDQAGIAALSGAIGWLPLVGDGISAALDLSNTGLDIARLQVPNKRARRKLKVKTL